MRFHLGEFLDNTLAKGLFITLFWDKFLWYSFDLIFLSKKTLEKKHWALKGGLLESNMIIINVY